MCEVIDLNFALTKGKTYMVSFKSSRSADGPSASIRKLIFNKETSDKQYDFIAKDDTHLYISPRNIRSVNELE